MRLTLRTMLAYLDDILEREDAEAIGKKIVGSTFATNLLQRIRDVTRRLRLGAPAVMDQGEGLDPNTVAEYLDHKLSDAQVPDFEEVCLKSDVHLAEVASCHQVLAIVLGEPAEVDPDSRQRMYQLPDLVAGPIAVGEGLVESPGDAISLHGDSHDAMDIASRPARSRVPDYLRDPPDLPGSGKRMKAASIVVVGVLIVMALAWLFGPGPLGSRSSPSAMEDKGQGPQVASEIGPSSAEADKGGKAEDDRRPEGSGEPQAARTLEPVEPPSEASTGSREVERPVPPAPRTGSSWPSPDGSAPPAERTGAAEKPDRKVLADSGPEGTETGDGRGREPTLQQPAGATSSDARPVPPPPRPGIPGGVPVSGLGPPVPAVALPAQQIGVFPAAKEVLLRIGARAGGWQRVTDQAALFTQDKLLALPAQQPTVVLAGGIRVHLIDGTQVQFLPAGPQGPPGLSVEYGRLIVKAEEGKARLRVQVGEQSGLLGLEGPDGAAAIEARRLEGLGGDPETQPGPMTGAIFAVAGKLLWEEEPRGKPVALNASERLMLGRPAGEARGPAQSPRWISADTTNTLDQRAAVIVERNLIPDRPAIPVLRDLTRHRQKEVRWMAMRSLALAGDFELLLDALKNVDQKLLWSDCTEQLRAAVVRGPQSAAQVRTAMEKACGPEGANLYEMLWKYRADSLRAEDAAQLVDYLDHDQLAFRVLGLWNLKNITGLTLTYRPEDPRSRRQSAIQRWRDRLRSVPTLRGKGATPGEKQGPPPVEATPATEPAG